MKRKKTACLQMLSMQDEYMTKEERVVKYLELAAKYSRYDTSHFQEELGVSDDDVREIQEKREKELSLKPVEKRNEVVKKVIKPLLKKHGFSVSGIDWRRSLEDDSYLMIHMLNSRFNGTAAGASFRFHISASKKEEIRGRLSNQWIYNQGQDLLHVDFLPYMGMLSPYCSGGEYKIDGYKNYLPVDTPLEEIFSQIEEDFGTYILPELDKVHCYDDFSKLWEEKRKRQDEKEIRILRYYHMAQWCARELTGRGLQELTEYRKKQGLNKEEILEHMDWLDVCAKNSDFPALDAREFALKAAED